MSFDGGDDACTHGASKSIYDRLTANAGNGFSAPLSVPQDDAVKALASACGEGVGDAIAAAGGLGSGGVSGSGTAGKLAQWTGASAIGDASEEAWHLIGGAGEPAFSNGWVNWS